MSRLNELSKLDSIVKIYVPSTIAVDKVNKDVKDIVEKVSYYLADTFGGVTCYKAQGKWVSNDFKLVAEDVVVCESHCTQGALSEHTDEIVDYCILLRDCLEQECIALEINGVMYFI